MFAVIWYNIALDALADAYVQADFATRDSIERAVTRLNSLLATNPNSLGESRPGRGRRIAHEPPCAIRFTVDDAAGGVRVTSFWTY
jgi:hypothetical protein